MIAKFKTGDGWRYFGDVMQANLLTPEAAARRMANSESGIDYDLGVACTPTGCKLVDLLVPGDEWVAVAYSGDAYLCTDKGETINAI